jgi:hypothetical protein
MAFARAVNTMGLSLAMSFLGIAASDWLERLSTGPATSAIASAGDR